MKYYKYKSIYWSILNIKLYHKLIFELIYRHKFVELCIKQFKTSTFLLELTSLLFRIKPIIVLMKLK